jgi:DNA-binding beta-propeller fold protein YncE
MRVALGSAVVLGLAGCAAAPMEMHYYPNPDGEGTVLVWPGPPEVARLSYAGELIGEVNFRAVEGFKEGAGVRLIRWIAGITGGGDKAAELIRPQSGMVDSSGRILVTDAGRQAVVVFDETNAEFLIWDEAEPAKSFLSPVGIAADGSGGYLVADADLGYLVRLSAEGVPTGRLDHESLLRPTGLARDPVSGELFVADSGAHDIKVFDVHGDLVRTIGHRGVESGEFNGPTHMSFANGRLYVSDTLNSRVQVLSAAGEPLSTIGRRGLYVGNLVRPKGVMADRDGHIYVIESYYDHLLIFNEADELLLPIGGTGSEAGRFFLPAGAWTDDGSRLFVADMFNGRVVVLDYLGGVQ